MAVNQCECACLTLVICASRLNEWIKLVFGTVAASVSYFEL